jgi:hypothetical protein
MDVRDESVQAGGLVETEEDWRDVPGYEGIYAVSRYGKVKSLDRTIDVDHYDRHGNHVTEMQISGGPLKGGTLQGGHRQVELRDLAGNHRRYLIHRLVMMAFGDSEPEGKPFVNHIDNDPGNNAYDNLEWVSPHENRLHGSIAQLVNEVGRDRARERVNEWIDRISVLEDGC